MTLSDQQVVTGLAILISGYTQLRCSLSSFHWQITVSLAWFSSVTHLMTLTCLRSYLQRRPLLRLFRICAMVTMAIMLVCAFVPAGWAQHMKGGRIAAIPAGLPAQCLWSYSGLETLLAKHAASPSYNHLYTIISLFYLVCSLFERALSLYPAWTKLVRKTAQEKFWERIERKMLLWQDSLRSASKLQQVWRIVRYKMAFALVAVVLCVTELYTSMLWEVRIPLLQSTESALFYLLLTRLTV